MDKSDHVCILSQPVGLECNMCLSPRVADANKLVNKTKTVVLADVPADLPTNLVPLVKVPTESSVN